MKKGYVFEKAPVEVMADTGPLYSSFAPDNIFVEPYFKSVA
jgi:hypothetical protein